MAASTTTTTTTAASSRPAAPPESQEERRVFLTDMLIFGATCEELAELARRTWQLSPQDAQELLRCVRSRLTVTPTDEERLFSLRLTRLQRNKLVGMALRYVAQPGEAGVNPSVLRALATFLTAVCGLLDSCASAADAIHALKDASPTPPTAPTAAPAPTPAASAPAANGPATPTANGPAAPAAGASRPAGASARRAARKARGFVVRRVPERPVIDIAAALRAGPDLTVCPVEIAAPRT